MIRSASRSIVIADLGLGNLHSVVHALERLGIAARVADDPDKLVGAGRVVLPGQGGFRAGVAALERGWREVLVEAARRGTPVLGICLGMQLLFERSEEYAPGQGLGLISGAVRALPRPDEAAHVPTGAWRIPHMGWNQVRSRHPLVGDGDWFYFVHSYHCVPQRPEDCIATSQHGREFCAVVAHGALLGCQFHVEKSGHAGSALLAAFAAWEGIG